jgi:hypothetical protein
MISLAVHLLILWFHILTFNLLILKASCQDSAGKKRSQGTTWFDEMSISAGRSQVTLPAELIKMVQ